MTAAMDAGRGKILIIDDEPDLVTGLKMLLEGEGYETLVAPSPLGLAFLLRRFDPDVILLDLSIPTLGGEALLRLDRRRIFPTTAAVILLSGRSREELADLAETHAVDGFFSKGEDAGELLLRVEKWIGLRRGRDAVAAGRACPPFQPEAVELQPVVVVRTNSAPSPSVVALQLAGYVVVKAGSDDLACALVDSCAASAVVVDLGVLAMNAFASSGLQRVSVPVLFLSSIPIVRGSSVLATLSRFAPKEALVTAVDRLIGAHQTASRAAAEQIPVVAVQGGSPSRF